MSLITARDKLTEGPEGEFLSQVDQLLFQDGSAVRKGINVLPGMKIYALDSTRPLRKKGEVNQYAASVAMPDCQKTISIRDHW